MIIDVGSGDGPSGPAKATWRVLLVLAALALVALLAKAVALGNPAWSGVLAFLILVPAILLTALWKRRRGRSE